MASNILSTPDNSARSESSTSSSAELSSCQSLTSEIKELLPTLKQSPEGRQLKVELKDRLQDLINSANGGRYVDLRLYGSTVSGFATRDSDLDLTLTSRVGSLYSIHRVIKDEKPDGITDLEIVTNIRVPLVRGRDTITQTSWQITESNDTGIKSALLQKMYAKVDPRVIPLVTVIKTWSNRQGISNSKNHLPNNYCWTLMVLFYLQVGCSPPVVPCMHRVNRAAVARISAASDPEADVEIPVFKSTNTQSLGELLKGFFQYYNENICCKQVFSIKEGRMLDPRSVRRDRSPAKQWDCLLLVEDPISLDNAPRSVFKLPQFRRIQAELRTANQKLRNGGKLEDIL